MILELAPPTWLVDLAIEENIVPDRIFNQWEVLSKWQLKSLIDLGLSSDHYLIDVGCGPGRLAVKAIQYLKAGRYYGMDPYPPYVRMAEKVLVKCNIQKEHFIIEGRASDCDKLPAQFQFAMAASVFTHMPATEIIGCLKSLNSIMRRGGIMLATYVERLSRRGILYAGTAPMHYEKFNAQNLSDWADEAGLTFEVYDISHPTGQRVGLFRF